MSEKKPLEEAILRAWEAEKRDMHYFKDYLYDLINRSYGEYDRDSFDKKLDALVEKGKIFNLGSVYSFVRDKKIKEVEGNLEPEYDDKGRKYRREVTVYGDGRVYMQYEFPYHLKSNTLIASKMAIISRVSPNNLLNVEKIREELDDADVSIIQEIFNGLMEETYIENFCKDDKTLEHSARFMWEDMDKQDREDWYETYMAETHKYY